MKNEPLPALWSLPSCERFEHAHETTQYESDTFEAYSAPGLPDETIASLRFDYESSSRPSAYQVANDAYARYRSTRARARRAA